MIVPPSSQSSPASKTPLPHSVCTQLAFPSLKPQIKRSGQVSSRQRTPCTQRCRVAPSQRLSPETQINGVHSWVLSVLSIQRLPSSQRSRTSHERPSSSHCVTALASSSQLVKLGTQRRGIQRVIVGLTSSQFSSPLQLISSHAPV